MIEEASPDLILMGGDMSDEKSSIEGSRILFEGLKDKYPIYYVSGNHEHWMFDSDGVFDMVKENSITVIDNTYVTITINGEHLLLAGLKDPDATLHYSSKDILRKNLETLDENLMLDYTIDPDTYKILLSHRPEHINTYKEFDYDLVLSGHAHGGQVRIPYILNGLYAPNQGFFPPKYAGGYYKVNDQMDFIIGRGLSLKKISTKNHESTRSLSH